MDNLCSLLFELSGEDRLRILRQLTKEPGNVTGLSRMLSLTTQECSRHISRLNEVGLIEKDSTGCYYLTSYGNLILKQLTGMGFTSKHKDYFTAHSLANLPCEFAHRIGELEKSKYVNDISAVFYKVDKLVQESKDYVWAITDHYLLSTYTLLTDAFERQVKVRTIESQDWVVPAEVKEGVRNLPPKHRRVAGEARISGILEEGLLRRLDVFLYISENEVAILCFPLNEGTFDHLGFSAKDRQSHTWCKDLFEYYWKKSHSRASLAQGLHDWIIERPEAIRALRDAATGKQLSLRDKQIQELESRSLMKRGRVTILGDMILQMLQ